MDTVIQAVNTQQTTQAHEYFLFGILLLFVVSGGLNTKL